MRAVLDHCVIDVRDALDDAAAACERLGFDVTPPSENTFGSINRLCVFGNTYLELLAIGPRAAGAQRDRMANPIGGNGLVFQSSDAAATAAELQQRNVAAGEVRAFSRPVDVDGAAAQAHFETVHLELPRAAPLRSYFARHYTPELIWRPEWSAHPNGALDIVGVTIVAEDAAALGSWFARAFEGAEERSDHWLVDAEHAWIDIRGIDAFEEKFGFRPGPHGRGAAICALTIATASSERSIVPPLPGINVAIEFV